MIIKLASKTSKQLFEICFEHNYYVDNAIADLDLEILPVLDSEYLFKNYRLIFKKSKNKIYLLHEHDDADGKPIVPLDEGLRISFVVLQKNPLFLNFTELPFFKPKKEVLYFNNLKTKLNAEKQSLSKSAFVTDSDLYPVSQRTFTYSPANKKAQIGIYDALNKCVYTHPASTGDIEIDLGDAANGLYSIWENKALIHKFILLDPIASRTIGFFDVFITKEQLEYMEKPNFESFAYSLNFKARELFWKYSVIKKYNDIDKSQIVDEREHYQFTSIDSDKQAGKKIFISDRKIELRERFDHQFKLITKNGSSKFERILFEKLTYPPITNLEKYKDEFVVNIFIYA